MPESRPRLQTSTPDHLLEPRSQIGVCPACAGFQDWRAVASNHELRTRFRIFRALQQERTKFTEGRNFTDFVPFQVFELWTRDTNQVPVPINVSPTKGQSLTRNSQAPEATQSDQTTPLSIGREFDNPQDDFRADNVFQLPVVPGNKSPKRFAESIKRVRRNQLMPYGVREDGPA